MNSTGSLVFRVLCQHGYQEAILAKTSDSAKGGARAALSHSTRDMHVMTVQQYSNAHVQKYFCQLLAGQKQKTTTTNYSGLQVANFSWPVKEESDFEVDDVNVICLVCVTSGTVKQPAIHFFSPTQA